MSRTVINPGCPELLLTRVEVLPGLLRGINNEAMTAGCTLGGWCTLLYTLGGTPAAVQRYMHPLPPIPSRYTPHPAQCTPARRAHLKVTVTGKRTILRVILRSIRWVILVLRKRAGGTVLTVLRG